MHQSFLRLTCAAQDLSQRMHDARPLCLVRGSRTRCAMHIMMPLWSLLKFAALARGITSSAYAGRRSTALASASTAFLLLSWLVCYTACHRMQCMHPHASIPPGSDLVDPLQHTFTSNDKLDEVALMPLLR